MYKILIVEDEEITALALDMFLSSIGYEITDCVNSAIDAYISIDKIKPDLILSDIMIKGNISGSELARDIYLHHNIPVVFLTAYFTDELLDYAIDSNAYGYIIKPYKEDELKATIKLAFNRIKGEEKVKSSIITFDTFCFDIKEKQVLQNNQTIKMGKKSLLLLGILINNINQSISNKVLIEQIYEYDTNTNLDNLRHLIKRIKEKLGTKSIFANKNIGYSIVLEK